MDDGVCLKIMILGDSGVGKTNLLLKYMGEFINENYIATLGIDYKTKNVVYNDTNVSLQIWDTAGQERFKSVTKSFIKGTDGIIFMYDISRKDTFLNLKHWITDINDLRLANSKSIICGNKIDLEEERKVTNEMKEKLSKELDCEIIEISAKKCININEPFDILLNKILGDMTKEQIIKKFVNNYSDISSISALTLDEKKKKRKRC